MTTATQKPPTVAVIGGGLAGLAAGCALAEVLKLPLDERGRRRAAVRAEWFSAQDKPLEVHDILDH